MHVLIPVLKLNNIVECGIIERTSRFTLLVKVHGREEIAYINNTGRLKDYIRLGKKGYCIENEQGKLRFRVIGIEDEGFAALVDTSLQEKSFLLAQRLGLIPWFTECRLYKRNYKVDDVLIDFAFKCNGGNLVLVELKSAIMKLGELFAGYPDAPTERGKRQLIKLARYAALGGKAYVVFVAGVPLVNGFKLYCGEDAEIKNVVKIAVESGVVFKALNIFLNPALKSIVLGAPEIPVDLSCEDTRVKA